MVYKIPPGITGFVEVYKIDCPQFKILCYSLQGLGLLKVIEVSALAYPDCVSRAKVKDKEDEFYIYLNNGALIFGFSKLDSPQKLQGSFIDKALIKDALEKLDVRYSVVSANILNSEVTKDNFVLLDKFEYEQVLYWYPHTIGEVIFSTNFD